MLLCYDTLNVENSAPKIFVSFVLKCTVNICRISTFCELENTHTFPAKLAYIYMKELWIMTLIGGALSG